jgi:hypothetical protein
MRSCGVGCSCGDESSGGCRSSVPGWCARPPSDAHALYCFWLVFNENICSHANAGMECSSALDALQIRATSRVSADGVSLTDDSPLIVVLLLHGGSESNNSSSSRLMLESLESIGPVIFPPRSAKNSSAMRVRCIPSSPPVCVVSTSITDALTAAASVRPDVVLMLPCCSSSSSSIEPSAQPLPSSDVTQLQQALPTVPILHPSNASDEVAALCGMLSVNAAVDWAHFAAAAISASRSIW